MFATASNKQISHTIDELHHLISRFIIFFIVTLIGLGFIYIIVWHLKNHIWDRFIGNNGLGSQQALQSASEKSISKCNNSEPPAGLVNMNIPYEGSDYESDTEYVASLSSSFSDVTTAECLNVNYDLIETQNAASLPSSRRTSLIPPAKNYRRTSLLVNFLTDCDSMPIDDSLRDPQSRQNSEEEETVTAHLHVGAYYSHSTKTLYIQLKTLNTLHSKLEENDQMYILVQVWRWDDSLHVYHKTYDGYRKKVSEFEFKSKLYSACRMKNSSKWDLEKCCFECVLTSYFIYTVTFKVVILDSFSRHNLWGDAHLVLRDILPDKDFDQWLAVCLGKEDTIKELLLSLCYLPTSERISLVIIKARNLKVEQHSNAIPTNAYVKVTLMAGGAKMKKRRTSTKLNDPNPVFNETFNFQLSEEERRQARFLISVRNDAIFESAEEAAMQTNLSVGGRSSTTMTSRNKEQRFCFGTVLIGPNLGEDTPADNHWQEMMKVPRRPVAQWHAII